MTPYYGDMRTPSLEALYEDAQPIEEDSILSVATEGVDKGPIRRPNGDHILGHNGPL